MLSMALYDIAYAAALLLGAALLVESIEIATSRKKHIGFPASVAFFLPSAVLFFFAIVIQDLILGIEKKRLMREIEELKTEVKKPMRKTPAKKTAALKAPVKARRGKKKR